MSQGPPGMPPGGAQLQGPPYLAPVAILGGRPEPKVDDPISAVLILLFLVGAVSNMVIFQVNRKRDHKFIISLLVFIFCMARVMALVLRIVWASRPTNVSLAIAANVFTAAGIVILFIVNVIFAQRILRAYHPEFGWHRATTFAFRFFLFSIVALLIMVVTATVVSFFTLKEKTRRSCRDIQLFAGTYLAVLAFLPVPIVVATWAWPRKAGIEKFGQGRFRWKIFLVLFTSTVLALGAGFRVAVSFKPRPINNPAWYHHRAAYYCFNYVLELTVVYLYTFMRFDRRFHIPNGSSGSGHYSGGAEKRGSTVSDHINTEAEAFGGDDDPSTRAGGQNRYTGVAV